jgi:putative ABC transport system permease protein
MKIPWYYKFLRPRWRKVLSDLWGNKVRSFLVVASISVGLFAVGLIATINGILSEDMPAGYRAVNPANIHITINAFDQNLVDSVRHFPGVKEAEGVRLFSLRIFTGSPDDWARISIKAIPEIEKMNLNRVMLLEGKWPPGDKEIVFDRHKREEIHANIGDMVDIKLPDGKIRALRLVGIVQDQTVGSGSGGGGYFVSPLVGFVDFKTLDYLGKPEKLNYLYMTVTGDDLDAEHIRAVENDVSSKLEKNSYTVLNSVIRRTNEHPNLVYVQAMSAILFTLGFLVVFLSGFLITNTLSSLLNQQVEQIGTMKTIGGVRSQVMGIYVTLILVFSLIGLAISLSTSGSIAYWLLGFLAREINFNMLGYRPIPTAILMQVLIALVVPQGAGFLPILRGSSLTIQDAFNGIGLVNYKNQFKWMDFLTERFSVPRPVLISLRNTFRQRGRLLLTLLTLTLGGAMFIATFNVQSSMNAFITALSKYFVADVRLSMDAAYRNQKIEQAVMNIPGVGSVEGWAAARAELLLDGDRPGDTVSLMAPPAGSKLIVPIVLQGRWLKPDDTNAIAINEMFLQHFPGIKPGDTIRMRVNGKKSNWVVVCIFQFAGKSGGYIAYANYDYLTSLTNQTQKSNTFQVVALNPLKSIEEQKMLGLQLEKALGDLGYKISDISPGLSLLSSAANGLNILIIFLLIMAILSAIVGGIGLTGTLSMNVIERTREIAVMRAIGASDSAVMRLVITEGLVIGFISWILASLLSLPISKALWGTICTSIFGYEAQFTLNLMGFLLWMLLVAVLTIVASYLPARNAAHLTIREALAYE